jgi:bifunctional ADP-heptose synthase (sugar kinase/adenylyltransferase)
MKILVIGEAIIDQYHQCEGMDKSRKSNVVVYKHSSDESFAGGALAIANHVAGIAKDVSLVTVMGSDKFAYASFLKKKMRSNVRMLDFMRKDGPTIVKRRFINSNQKLFEICYFNDDVISPALENKVMQKISNIIRMFDLVIVSDFGHGFLTDKLAKAICSKAKFLAVNTQTNGANMGFNYITKYSNVDYTAVDELEIRYAAHDKAGELSRVMKEVAAKIKC